MPERGQTSGFTVSEYLCLLNHTGSLSITTFSFHLRSVPYLSHCSLFDQALRNELCVLKIQVFIYLSFVCSVLVLQGICTPCVRSCHLCI